MVKREDKVIFEGLIGCWGCLKAVNGKLVVRGDFTYLIYDCPIHGKYECLLGKEEDNVNLVRKNIPSFWPQWNPKLGTMWDDTNIINRRNIQVLAFDVTTKCNSSCKICDLWKQSETLTDVNFLKKKISFYKNKEVLLCGGESTTRKDLPELLQLIKKSGNIPVIHTNGLLLANEKYIKALKSAGLTHIHLSFDGFGKEIYEKARGGYKDYDLKMAALNNMKKENIKVSLAMVPMKGINEDQISEMIKYASINKNIVEVTFWPFFLTEIAKKNGLTTDNILSPEEIKDSVIEALHISKEEFLLWDNAKINLAFYLQKLKIIPSLLSSFLVFGKGTIYMQRTRDGVRPLLDTKQLNKLNFALKNNNIKDIFGTLGIEIVKILLKNPSLSMLREDSFLYKTNMFKINATGYEAGWSLFLPFTKPLFHFNVTC